MLINENNFFAFSEHPNKIQSVTPNPSQPLVLGGGDKLCDASYIKWALVSNYNEGLCELMASLRASPTTFNSHAQLHWIIFSMSNFGQHRV